LLNSATVGVIYMLNLRHNVMIRCMLVLLDHTHLLRNKPLGGKHIGGAAFLGGDEVLALNIWSSYLPVWEKNLLKKPLSRMMLFG